MNAQRRKAIAALQSKLEDLAGEVTAIAEEEREYYDNMPEAFQQGEKGDAAESAASTLEEVAGELENLVSQLDDAANA